MNGLLRRAHESRERIRWVLVGVLLLLVVAGAVDRIQEAMALPANRASDALPIYLSSAAVIDGGDPTTQEGLQAAYDARKLQVRAETFSNLYPASAGVLLQPLALGSWEQFVVLWRGLLLLGVMVGGAAGAAAGVRGPGTPLAAALGAWLAVTGFPVTGEGIALGQANLLMAGAMGLVILAFSRGCAGVGA
ncbi:MAG: hypothetical protein QGG40_17475, partial [Myxococcota bacterium]|nr:hypothetical protein [Myxococcota bacterium]